MRSCKHYIIKNNHKEKEKYSCKYGMAKEKQLASKYFCNYTDNEHPNYIRNKNIDNSNKTIQDSFPKVINRIKD